MGRRMLPWLPTDLLMTYRFDNEGTLPKLDIPVFIIHGDADRLIPVADAHILYERATGRKDIWLVDGADHNDAYFVAGHEFYRRIAHFSDDAIGPRDHSGKDSPAVEAESSSGDRRGVVQGKLGLDNIRRDE